MNVSRSLGATWMFGHRTIVLAGTIPIAISNVPARAQVPQTAPDTGAVDSVDRAASLLANVGRVSWKAATDAHVVGDVRTRFSAILENPNEQDLATLRLLRERLEASGIVWQLDAVASDLLSQRLTASQLESYVSDSMHDVEAWDDICTIIQAQLGADRSADTSRLYRIARVAALFASLNDSLHALVQRCRHWIPIYPLLPATAGTK